MPLYATASVEELRSKVDLIELIGSYMPLKKYGAQFKACCPFHQEKTPSFYVYPDHYHCFGCNAHGDAMGFIMQYLKLSFIESIELLAEKFQVRLERAEEAGEKIPVKEMKELMLNAARLFHLHLLFTEEGKEAQKYLFERGISLEFIERSMLGLAPLDPELIVGMLGKENPLLKEVGLVMKQRQNHCFFISRLMFPIRDYQGAVIGFSGRHYKKESTGGKYINTPETPLFHKGSVLFGFDSARLSIAREGVAIITEGQIDTLRMQYAGFENTVSALGTAFGEAHVKKLVQLGISKAILLFDSDKAGHAAALKVGQLFQCAAVEARAALLPKGEDPDSFLRRHLKGQMDNVLGSAMPFLEFALKYYRHLSGGDSPALRQEVVRKMMELVEGWQGHPVMIYEGKRRLASLLNIPEDLLLHGEVPAEVKEPDVATAGRLEWGLLRCVFFHEDKEWLGRVFQSNPIHSYLTDPFCRKFIPLFMENRFPDMLSLAACIDSETEQEKLSELFDVKLDPAKSKEAILEIVQKFFDNKWLGEREALKQELEKVADDEEKASALLKRFDAIKNERPKVQR